MEQVTYSDANGKARDNTYEARIQLLTGFRCSGIQDSEARHSWNRLVRSYGLRPWE